MKLDIDITLLKTIQGLTIGQLVFLALVLDNSQKKNQDISKLLSLVEEVQIQELINVGLIRYNPDETSFSKKYKATPALKECLSSNDMWFERFYEIYPSYVTRPDGTKGFLRGNKNKCREAYLKYVKNNAETHLFLIDCLKFDITNKTQTGKLGYMKTMWNWITQQEWDSIDEQMKSEEPVMNSYGTKLL